jgi:hypothetical protein
MRILIRLSVLLLLCLASAGFIPRGAAAAPTTPTLVAIRAAHHPGYDRIVYEFKGGLPASRRVKYVDELIADGSGLPVMIAGRAILSVRFERAQAHVGDVSTVPARTAFKLPNIMTTVRSGDFEAVTTYGVGLAKKTSVKVFTLRSPSRVVIDIGASFRTVNRKVYFFNRDNYLNNTPPFYSSRLRPVLPGTPATGVMDRLFAGPLTSERAAGLRLLRSHATGFSHLSITDRVARVRLTGGCSSDGSTETIAGEIMPTLRQFGNVDWVKIFDPTGHTENPTGHTDSIPECLEP